ncbi:YkgJ family cysteine cluster protein [Geomonas edaphica]|uniref:YkgJ family cysteine cluster protein n=1 Tax=Geomonas edaphica TaxID=2570226 RepID=UPI0010A7F80A|nr:YkgJ family cysteine cluster protein [Geomonas edaphica]
MLFARHHKDKRHGLLLDHPLDDPSCCRECAALCCRSFPNIDLTWEEYLRLEELGATRLHFSLYGPHKLIIENGCEFLDGNRCGIYEARPAICRRFFCRPAPD